MVAMYTIAGRQVGSHVLAMLTLGVTFSGAALAMRGGETSKKQGPPINATSKEEENFINEFLKQAEAESSSSAATAKH